jgi:hypothetical protein
MFYDVKIFDGKGKLKKIVTREISSRRHWDKFFDIKFNPKTPVKDGAKKRKPRRDWQYEENFYSEE